MSMCEKIGVGKWGIVSGRRASLQLLITMASAATAAVMATTIAEILPNEVIS
jgi:hypothetical protein